MSMTGVSSRRSTACARVRAASRCAATRVRSSGSALRAASRSWRQRSVEAPRPVRSSSSNASWGGLSEIVLRAAARAGAGLAQDDLADGPRGLVLMLHGCTQNPDDFARGTAMNSHAERSGLIVLYP